MRLNCTVNGSPVSMVVNSDKPLNQILQELLDTFTINNFCKGASCGNCIVLINGEASLSCLIPAFRLNGSSVLTFEGYQKTRFCHDIERAYAEIGNHPCPLCYASKTMLIESIMIKMDKARERIVDTSFVPPPSVQNKAKIHKVGLDNEMIQQEMSISKCSCIELSELTKIIELAYKYRSRRRVRRF